MEALGKITLLQSTYLTENELRQLGFKSLGRNVRISADARIYGTRNISIGDNVRIDDFTTIAATSGRLSIGSFIHIGAHCHINAAGGIVMEDFTGLSQGVCIYSSTDDYSGQYLTNPMVPTEFTSSIAGEVVLKKHVIVGSGSVILPRVTIGEGASVGALSLVTKTLDAWGVFFGSPAKRLKDRSRNLLELEARLKEKLLHQA